MVSDPDAQAAVERLREGVPDLGFAWVPMDDLRLVLDRLAAVEARGDALAAAVRAEASDGRGVGGRLAAALAAYEAGGAGDDLLARAEAAEADADRLAAALTYVLKRFSDTPNFDLLLPEGGPDESALRLHDEAVACGTPPGAAT